MKSLIIEDEAHLANMVKEVAELEGFDTRHASTPREIESHHSEFQPDLIIMDLLMPDIDGLEVMQYLSQTYSAAQIAILSGSYSESREMAERMGKALGLHVIANFGKPMRVKQLRELFTQVKNQASGGARQLA